MHIVFLRLALLWSFYKFQSIGVKNTYPYSLGMLPICIRSDAGEVTLQETVKTNTYAQ